MASILDQIETAERPWKRVVVRGARPKVTTEFVTTGTEDHDIAYTYTLNNLPTTVDGLLLNEITKSGTESPSTHVFNVVYAVDPIPTPNNPFAARGTTRGGRSKIFRSYETTAEHARAGAIATELNGAIEFDPNSGNINGADVFSKNLEFSWDIYIPAAVFSTTYTRMLYAMTPSINEFTWAGGLFKAGECLFMGADWELTKDPNDPEKDLVKLGFYFGGSIEEEITVPGFNSGNPIVKPGWHHFWISWMEDKNPTSGAFIKQPREVRVERLYKWFDFKKLGLGF